MFELVSVSVENFLRQSDLFENRIQEGFCNPTIRKMDFMDETVPLILTGKYPYQKERSALEAYNKAPMFIPVDITEDVV